MGGYSLEVEFPDQSPSFAYGFEAGRIYAAMKSGEAHILATINEENAEFITSLGMRLGYDVIWEKLTDEWAGMEAVRRSTVR